MHENVCEFLREHAMKINNLKKETLNLLTKEKEESLENSKFCYNCKGKFENKYSKNKKYYKVRDHFHYAGEYRGAAHSICNFKYSVPKVIPIVSLNVSNYFINL